MASKKSFSTYIFIFLTLAGIILACSSLISNDYVKLLIVMVTLAVGLFGIMKSLSNPANEDDKKISEE